jgi:hypothetical protein
LPWGSTQPLTEMSTRNLPGGKGRPESKFGNLTIICEPIVWKMWEPQRLTTLLASTACYSDSFTFISRQLDGGAQEIHEVPQWEYPSSGPKF